MSGPTIESTDAFVEVAHRGQPYGDEPYINHLRRVARRLTAHGEWAVMAGLLHDWVEDCDGDLAALYDMGYPDVVVEAVDAVTLRPSEEYNALIMRASQHPLGCLVKLADNHDNTDRLGTLAESDPVRAARLDKKYEQARNVLTPALGRHLIDRSLRGDGVGVVFGPAVREADLPW